MIVAAQQAFPEQTWMRAEIGSWQPDHAIDVVYSNAALQWLPDHAGLIRRLFSWVADNGVFAFQIPSSNYASVRALVHELSYQSNWTQKMMAARKSLTIECPAFYYDTLCSEASRVDLWETEYNHVLESPDSIVDWISSTGLRPFLIALESAVERQQFVAELRERVAATYEKRADGKVLFPFRRTFVIAYR
jgi:trans-aconitate 2-methyltransferase